jgi:hypothetical protein
VALLIDAVVGRGLVSQQVTVRGDTYVGFQPPLDPATNLFSIVIPADPQAFQLPDSRAARP